MRSGTGSSGTARRAAIAFVAFAACFTALCVASYTRESATYDEPAHLAAGYAMWTLGDYRFSPDHLPLSRLWATVPLLFMDGIRFDAAGIRDVSTDDWMLRRQFEVAHEFLYRWNDADALLYRARFMVVLLGIGLGGLVFLWARELFGFGPAAVALALCALEPNLLAHSRLTTADVALTFALFGAAYFLFRTCRRLSAGNLAGLVLFFAAAQATKTWALLLMAPLAILLAARAVARSPWPSSFARARGITTRGAKCATAAAVLALALIAAFTAIWGSYRFRYAPDPAGREPIHLEASGMVRERLGEAPPALLWLDAHRVLPNAYLQGFLYGNATIQRRPSFLNGDYRDTGWWWYFPYAILVKTPLTLLLAAAAGLAVCARRRDRTSLAHLALTPALFLAVAMAGPIQIGLRHVLIVYPFLLLAASAAASALPANRKKAGYAAMTILAAIELSTVWPHCLAFGNVLIGGPAHLYEHLSDSNVDWGQDLKGLGRYVKDHHIDRINLCYFGTADPAYYGIEATHLPGAPFFAESEAQLPILPGYVAVSATHLQGSQFIPTWRAFYAPLKEQAPIAVIGHSIFVYRIDQPWWDSTTIEGRERQRAPTD